MIRVKKPSRGAKAVVISLISLSFSQALYAGFPNYFGEIPKDTAQASIEHALSSMMDRIDLPIQDNLGGKDSPKTLADLNQRVQKIYPGAKIYLSGDNLQNLLGLLYEKITLAKANAPDKPIKALLKEIEESKERLSPVEAFGIDRPMDLLVIPPHQSSAQPGQSAADWLGPIVNPNKSDFHLGDLLKVEWHSDHNKYLNSVGGNSLNRLALSIGGDGIIDPSSHSSDTSIFQKFLKGQYDFKLPKEEEGRLDIPTLVNGLQPLLENPYLKLSAEGDHQLQEQLKDLEKLTKSHTPEATQAISQIFPLFKKLFLNSRFGGAHNRFYHPSSGEIEKLVWNLSSYLKGGSLTGERAFHLVPQYLEDHGGAKEGLDPCHLQEYFISKKEFKKDYSDQGALFHASQNIKSHLGIMRNGLIVSKNGQGRNADVGEGVYFSPDLLFTRGFRTFGQPIEFKLKENSNPRILKWRQAKDSEQMKRLRGEAAQNSQEINDYLKKVCGVDILVNYGLDPRDRPNEKMGADPYREVVVLDHAILEYPRTFQELGAQASDRFKNAIEKMERDPKDLKNQEFLLDSFWISDQLHSKFSKLHLPGFFQPNLAELIRLFDKLSLENQLGLVKYPSEILGSRDYENLIASLQNRNSLDPKIRESVKTSARALQDAFLNQQLYSLAKANPEDPKVIDLLIEAVRSKSDQRSNAAHMVIFNMSPEGKKKLTPKLIDVLQDKDPEIRKNASHVLRSDFGVNVFDSYLASDSRQSLVKHFEQLDCDDGQKEKIKNLRDAVGALDEFEKKLSPDQTKTFPPNLIKEWTRSLEELLKALETLQK